MAISFIEAVENDSTEGGDVTLTFAGSLLQNDLVIVAYSIGDNDAVNQNMVMLTSGYTEVADLFVDTGTEDLNLGVFYKFMTATPDTSAQVDGLGGTDAAVAAVCMVFRGVDTAGPFDTASTTATGTGSFSPNPPSNNHGNLSGAWSVIVGAAQHNLGSSGTYTFPTGYTTNAIDRGSNDTTDCTIGMGYDSTPADPEDPGIMTHSGSDNARFAWAAVTMILKEGASANPRRYRTRQGGN
jgi:hypothetical protein